MREGRVRAHDIEFGLLEEGEGPLVLFLHGFPDNAYTWSAQLQACAAAGYRAVAVFQRGYAPTEVPASGFYDLASLATDARELIGALGSARAFVVGHDWGAAVAYSLAAAYPDAVRAAVSIGICHPKALFNMLTMPEQIQNFFQLWFFQLVGIAEFAVSANDYAFIDYFWRFRSSGYVDPEHLVCVKRTLDAPGSLEAALGYYRAGFDRARQDATLVHVAEAINQVTPVPMHAVFGDRDIKRHLAATQHELFAGPYRLSVVEGCGHFVHRERPEVLTRLILDWFATHGGTGR